MLSLTTRTIVASTLGAVALASAPALAVSTLYFGEDLQTGTFSTSFAHPNADAASANFAKNISNIVTQDFEGIAVGTTSPIAVTFGASTATITGTTAEIRSSPSSGAFATSGTHYVFATSDLVLTFSQPQAAFGFYGTDIGDSGATSLILTLGNGASEQVTLPANFTSSANGSVLFAGIIAPKGQEFTSVTFPNNSNGGDFFGFDDFTIATPSQVMPEPASLTGLALGATALLRRRSRR